MKCLGQSGVGGRSRETALLFRLGFMNVFFALFFLSCFPREVVGVLDTQGVTSPGVTLGLKLMSLEEAGVMSIAFVAAQDLQLFHHLGQLHW